MNWVERVGSKSGMCLPLSQMYSNHGKKNLLSCCKICQTFLAMLLAMLNIANSSIVICVFGFLFPLHNLGLYSSLYVVCLVSLITKRLFNRKFILYRFTLPYTCFLLKIERMNKKRKWIKRTEKKTQHLHCFWCCCSFVSVCVCVTCASCSKCINNEWELSCYSLLPSCSLFSNVCVHVWVIKDKTNAETFVWKDAKTNEIFFSNRRHP